MGILDSTKDKQFTLSPSQWAQAEDAAAKRKADEAAAKRKADEAAAKKKARAAAKKKKASESSSKKKVEVSLPKPAAQRGTAPKAAITKTGDPETDKRLEAEAKSAPIGVLPGYTVTKPGRKPVGNDPISQLLGRGQADLERRFGKWLPDEPTEHSVGVQYWDGDEDGIQGNDPREIMKLQNQLVDAGILKRGSFTPGKWEVSSKNAMIRVMTTANQQGVPKEEVIKNWNQFSSDEDQLAGQTLTLKNPEDIKRFFEATAPKVIGRSLSAAETESFLAGYQDIDRRAQEAIAAQKVITDNGGVGVVTAPESEDSYITRQLRQKNKGETDWVTMNNNMKEFYSILGTGSVIGYDG